MWLFAYGSLIFRPGFAYIERRVAWMHGYARRFWQWSPDHRGTPEAPGLVLLVPAQRLERRQTLARGLEAGPKELPAGKLGPETAPRIFEGVVLFSDRIVHDPGSCHSVTLSRRRYRLGLDTRRMPTQNTEQAFGFFLGSRR